MAAAMRQLWHDPVWSKVIAAGITALAALILAWIGTHILAWIGNFDYSWLFAIALLGGIGGLALGFLIFRKQQEPNITKVSARISTPVTTHP